VHGDIKPLNVLVYRYDEKLIAKLADFGDSSIGTGAESVVTMPKSRPWFAPEHHGRGSSVRQAQMMEAYSFGLVCFWLLLSNRFQYDGQGSTTGLHPSIAMVENLKHTNTLHIVARKILLTAEDLSLEQKNNLLLLFDRILANNPEDRVCFFPGVRSLLGKSRR
jgi:serine/threonine protein kinase